MRTPLTILATFVASAAAAHPGHTALAAGHTHPVDPIVIVAALVVLLGLIVGAVLKFR